MSSELFLKIKDETNSLATQSGLGESELRLSTPPLHPLSEGLIRIAEEFSFRSGLEEPPKDKQDMFISNDDVTALRAIAHIREAQILLPYSFESSSLPHQDVLTALNHLSFAYNFSQDTDSLISADAKDLARGLQEFFGEVSRNMARSKIQTIQQLLDDRVSFAREISLFSGYRIDRAALQTSRVMRFWGLTQRQFYMALKNRSMEYFPPSEQALANEGFHNIDEFQDITERLRILFTRDSTDTEGLIPNAQQQHE